MVVAGTVTTTNTYIVVQPYKNDALPEWTPRLQPAVHYSGDSAMYRTATTGRETTPDEGHRYWILSWVQINAVVVGEPKP